MKKIFLSKKYTNTTQVIIGLVVVILLASTYRCAIEKICTTRFIEQFVRHEKHIVTPKGSVSAEVVDTQSSRERGLSGRTGLAEDEGLLFIFETSGRYGFWMKDMLFPIDIIWINKEGVVVHLERNLSPDSYFKTDPPQTFINTPEAKYVLELQAGSAEKHGLYLGTKVQLGE